MKYTDADYKACLAIDLLLPNSFLFVRSLQMIAQTTPSMLDTVQAGKTWATVNQVDYWKLSYSVVTL